MKKWWERESQNRWKNDPQQYGGGTEKSIRSSGRDVTIEALIEITSSRGDGRERAAGMDEAWEKRD